MCGGVSVIFEVVLYGDMSVSSCWGVMSWICVLLFVHNMCGAHDDDDDNC